MVELIEKESYVSVFILERRYGSVGEICIMEFHVRPSLEVKIGPRMD